MLINDVVTAARRILGDTQKQRWSDSRMLDIVNAGLRDINKFTGAYRKEYFIELGQNQFRYHLPTDIVSLTAIEYEDERVPLVNDGDTTQALHASKDQVNIGVLVMKNLPDINSRQSRFKQGPTGNLLPQPTDDLWSGGVWHNNGLWRDDQKWGSPYFSTAGGLGVVSNPLLKPDGVASGAVLSPEIYDKLPNTAYGILTDIHRIGNNTVIPSGGDTFGVLTNLSTKLTPQDKSIGGIGAVVNKPYRIAGRYGSVVSVLKKPEYVKVAYRALPKHLTSLEIAFPLSPTWLEPMINWVVGSALQDDNDASNINRAQLFLQRYTRELEQEVKSSWKDYSSAEKKYETKYNGRIR